MLKAGPYEVYSLVSESFRLDGGAMFGVVPKTLWSKLLPADEKNRIQLTCRNLVLKGEGRTILVDLGCGRKWDSKFKEIYGIEYVGAPIHERVPDVTDIILTHLHFDHCGGISHLDAAGNLHQSFPNATVYLQEEHFKHAKNSGPRERASFLKENLEPLANSTLKLLSGNVEILPGIRSFVVSGHTHALQVILIGSGSDTVAYPSDLIPTSHHIPVPYVMGYDLCAETSMREKEGFLTRAHAENWTVIFEHDFHHPAFKIAQESPGRFSRGTEITIPEF